MRFPVHLFDSCTMRTSVVIYSWIKNKLMFYIFESADELREMLIERTHISNIILAVNLHVLKGLGVLRYHLLLLFYDIVGESR